MFAVRIDAPRPLFRPNKVAMGRIGTPDRATLKKVTESVDEQRKWIDSIFSDLRRVRADGGRPVKKMTTALVLSSAVLLAACGSPQEDGLAAKVTLPTAEAT